MTQRPIGPRQKVTLKITQAQADLILENDYIDQEVLDSLDFSEPHAGIVGLRCTLDALEEVQGYIAAESNHAKNKTLRRSLGELFDAIDSFKSEFIEEEPALGRLYMLKK